MTKDTGSTMIDVESASSPKLADDSNASRNSIAQAHEDTRTMSSEHGPDAKRARSSKGPIILGRRSYFYLGQELNTSHVDILLLTCCFISGLVDSSIYNAYGTFVSMQTGNTIFIGLGASTAYTTTNPYGWTKSLVSVFCFCLGCFFFSRLVRFMGPSKRGTLMISFSIQTIMVAIAATIMQTGLLNGAISHISLEIEWNTIIPIALLSFQAAGQIVASRSLCMSELPTIVLTTMLHDTVTDPKLFARGWPGNIKRNRRIVAFILVLSGAIAGGFISKATDELQATLWAAAGLKGFLVVAWSMWPTKRSSSDTEAG